MLDNNHGFFWSLSETLVFQIPKYVKFEINVQVHFKPELVIQVSQTLNNYLLFFEEIRKFLSRNIWILCS